LAELCALLSVIPVIIITMMTSALQSVEKFSLLYALKRQAVREAAAICPRPQQVVTWRATQIIYASGDLDLWLFWPWNWCAMSPVARTNLLPNFDATFLCRVMGKHASKWRRDGITLTFDLWRYRACRWCSLWYSNRTPSLKLVGRPIPKIWHIFRLSINRPVDLDL